MKSSVELTNQAKKREENTVEREKLNDQVVEEVVGGSIVFNGDHTTCGHNCNNQYKVLDYDAVLQYIKDNCTKMPEKKMLANMLAAGLLKEL